MAPEHPLLTAGDLQKLVQASARSSRPHRDRALVYLFWYFGPSPRQVLTLTPRDVDLIAGRIRWPGGAEQALPADAMQALSLYVGRERDARCPRLFSGRHARAMTTVQIDRFFRRLRALAGVPATPRSLRTCALYRMLQAQPSRAMAAVMARRSRDEMSG